MFGARQPKIQVLNEIKASDMNVNWPGKKVKIFFPFNIKIILSSSHLFLASQIPTIAYEKKQFQF